MSVAAPQPDEGGRGAPFAAALLGTRGLGKEQRIIDAGLAYARAKHRARMLVLYYYAELENRSRRGDDQPQRGHDRLRGEVGRQRRRHRAHPAAVQDPGAAAGRVPRRSEDIIRKAPHPDLLPGIVDETALGIDYETLDGILEGLDRGWDAARVASVCSVPEAQVRDVQEMVRRSRHLREAAPRPDLGGAEPTGLSRR